MVSAKKQDDNNGSSSEYKDDDGPVIEVEETGKAEGTVTFGAALFSCTKSAVGIGTIYLGANAVKAGGLTYGVVILLIGAVSCGITAHFMARLAANFASDNYFVIAKLALGSTGETVAVVSLLLYLYAVLIVYMGFMGESFRDGLISLGVKMIDSKSSIPTLLCLVCMILFSFVKEKKVLDHVSKVGMAGILYITALCAIDYFVGHDLSGTINSHKAKGVVRTMLGTCGTMSTLTSVFADVIFAYVNHFTVVSKVAGLIDRSAPARRKLVFCTTLFATFIYLAVCCMSYLRYKELLIDETTGSVLTVLKVGEMHSEDGGYLKKAYGFGMLIMAVVIFFSYPLLLDPTMESLDQLIADTRFGKLLGKDRLYYFESWTLTISATVVALKGAQVIPPIRNFFTSLCAAPLVFIFPAWYFYNLKYKYRVHKIELVGAAVVVLIGLVVWVYGSFTSAMGIVDMVRKIMKDQPPLPDPTD